LAARATENADVGKMSAKSLIPDIGVVGFEPTTT